MDQYTRRIIGFGLHAGAVDGNALCQMFNHAIRGQRSIPKYLSSDNDPLYRFHQWQANLRILGVSEIKTVPYVPLSHPFVERLIGTIRRECLDRTLFWTTVDLESKLLDFKAYFNHHRTHRARAGRPPDDRSRTSTLIDGNLTAEDCIKHRWLLNPHRLWSLSYTRELGTARLPDSVSGSAKPVRWLDRVAAMHSCESRFLSFRHRL